MPLIKDASGWRFDAAAGREEVMSRRIGRNELAVMQICRTYVEAQRIYAASGHDGQPTGVCATMFRSDPGKRNGLYWPAGRTERRSPLGRSGGECRRRRPIDRSARARRPRRSRLPFQDPDRTGTENAPGGAKSYLVGSRMSGGFALVAWPARYGVTGIMTFVVNRDAVLHEKDLGPDTTTSAKGMTIYNPDDTWTVYW